MSSMDSVVLSFSKYVALDPDCKPAGFLLSLNHKRNQKSGENTIQKPNYPMADQSDEKHVDLAQYYHNRKMGD